MVGWNEELAYLELSKTDPMDNVCSADCPPTYGHGCREILYNIYEVPDQSRVAGEHRKERGQRIGQCHLLTDWRAWM